MKKKPSFQLIFKMKNNNRINLIHFGVLDLVPEIRNALQKFGFGQLALEPEPGRQTKSLPPTVHKRPKNYTEREHNKCSGMNAKIDPVIDRKIDQLVRELIWSVCIFAHFVIPITSIFRRYFSPNSRFMV